MSETLESYEVVSIHAPVRGRLECSPPIPILYKVSIHAPVRGRPPSVYAFEMSNVSPRQLRTLQIAASFRCQDRGVQAHLQRFQKAAGDANLCRRCGTLMVRIQCLSAIR